MPEQDSTIHEARPARSAFYALAAAAFVSGANLRMFDALLPKLAEDFGESPAGAALVVTAFTLAYGLFQVVHGPLGDLFGKLRVIAAAALIASAASLGSAFAPSLPALAWLRFATGIGAAAIVPLAIAWIGDNSSYATRQATLGRFVSFLLLGQVLGPALGGALAQFAGWREVLHVMTVVFLIVSAALFREDRASRTRPAATSRQNILRNYSQVLRDRWVRAVMLTVFLEGALFFGSFAYSGAYLKLSFDLPYLTIGLILACYGLGGVVYSLLVSRLLPRLGETGFVRMAAVILLACFIVLPLLPAWQATIPVFTATGFGLYMLHNTLQTKATEMAPQARGTALAVFAFSLFLGQAIGVAACGLAIRIIGYGWTFAAAGLLLLPLGLWFAARIARQEPAPG